MLICIDSNQFIFGVTGADADAATLMDILPKLDVAVPRLVVNEAVRNLAKVGMDKQFFATIHQSERFRTDMSRSPPNLWRSTLTWDFRPRPVPSSVPSSSG